jgi:CheY-like chemotaxis protein
VDIPMPREDVVVNVQYIHQGTETVLLVEDQEDVRSLARDVLESCGYTVLEAANGVSALDLAAQYTGPIELLLTDAVMPGMNGRELSERLTELRLTMVSSTPVSRTLQNR